MPEGNLTMRSIQSRFWAAILFSAAALMFADFAYAQIKPAASITVYKTPT